MSGCGRCEEQGPACGVIAVAAIDDHPVFLLGIRAHLAENFPCIQMTVIAATVDGLLADPQPAPTVVLLDVRLGDGSLVEDNVLRIRKTGARVVLYTSEHRPAVIRRAIEAGAVGLILKEDEEYRLVEAIRMAHDGYFYVSSRLAYQVASDPSGQVKFTDREREVVGLRALGLPWRTVGRRLDIAAATARTHADRALAKYAVAIGERVDGPGDLVLRAIADGHVLSAPATNADR